MGPIQEQNQQQDTETKRTMTLDEVIDSLGKQGIQIEGLPESPEALSMDQKIATIIESLGGMPQQGGDEITEEQRLILENQYRQDLKMKILETEKEIRMKHPDASESQLWEAAHAFLRGDVIGVSDIFSPGGTLDASFAARS